MERPSHACPICGRPGTVGHVCDAEARLRRLHGGAVPDRARRGTDLVGRIIGQNYRVLQPIGAGGMGVVYLVEHVALKKRFAAKVLSPELARHPEAAARFETEAHAVSKLDHENIVSVIDFGRTDDGCVYIIMEHLRGKSLQARMDEPAPLTLDEVVGIVMQICQALAAAHAAGIVHRDIKPDNIFLTMRPGGRPLVKVLDFGIAKARESRVVDGRITMQGQLLGSPEYMSPEASRGDEVDSRADTYAVGVLLYELLCGKVPFRNPSSLKVLQMQATQPPRPPRELVPELPPRVERLILRALEKDPRRRQPSIQKLQVELMAALPDVAQRATIQIQAAPPVHWMPRVSRRMLMVRGTMPGMDVPNQPAYAELLRREESTLDVKRSPRGLLAILWSAAAVVTAVALVLLVVRRPQRAPSPPPVGRAPAADIVGSAPAADRRPFLGPAICVQERRAEVRLRIATSPPGAATTLDGQYLGRTPIETWVPTSAEAARVELELPGYATGMRSLTLDRDREISIELRRVRGKSGTRM